MDWHIFEMPSSLRPVWEHDLIAFAFYISSFLRYSSDKFIPKHSNLKSLFRPLAYLISHCRSPEIIRQRIFVRICSRTQALDLLLWDKVSLVSAPGT